MRDINQTINKKITSEFTLERTLDAPVELVWKVWTEPKHLNLWWGPKGYTMLTNKLELKHGGIFHYQLKTPLGQSMWGKFVFREIEEFKKLSFVVSFSDEFGNILRHPMSMSWPLEVFSTVTFSEIAGKTHLHLTAIPVNASDNEIKTFVEGFNSMNQGWKGTFEQLEDYLKKISN